MKAEGENAFALQISEHHTGQPRPPRCKIPLHSVRGDLDAKAVHASATVPSSAPRTQVTEHNLRLWLGKTWLLFMGPHLQRRSPQTHPPPPKKNELVARGNTGLAMVKDSQLSGMV